MCCTRDIILTCTTQNNYGSGELVFVILVPIMDKGYVEPNLDLGTFVRPTVCVIHINTYNV
jgi:hypothetical protein